MDRSAQLSERNRQVIATIKDKTDRLRKLKKEMDDIVKAIGDNEDKNKQLEKQIKKEEEKVSKRKQEIERLKRQLRENEREGENLHNDLNQRLQEQVKIAGSLQQISSRIQNLESRIKQIPTDDPARFRALSGPLESAKSERKAIKRDQSRKEIKKNKNCCKK